MDSTTISSFEIFHIRIPMKFAFKTSFGEIPFRETVIIKLTTNTGLVGWGESAVLSEPVYLEESIHTALAILEHVIKPLVVGQSLTPEEFVQRTNHLKGNKLAKYGVECALWTILSQVTGESLSKLLGGTRKSVALGESIGILPGISETITLIEKRISQGYHRIKVKIEPGWDIQLVSAIRKQFPDLVLMVDANSSYTLEDIAVFHALDKFNLLMIEQPLEFDDIYYHSLLQKKINTPLCLDESITSFSKAKKAIEMKACRIINVKPGRIGSLIETKKINALAKETNTPLWCGGMLESGIANTFNIYTAALSEFSLPADIFPSSKIFPNDIITPEISMNEDGMVEVPTNVGLGFLVNEDKIKEFSAK